MNYITKLFFMFPFILLLIAISINPFVLAPKLNGIFITVTFILLYYYIYSIERKQSISTIEGVWFNEDSGKYISIDRDDNELLILKGIINTEGNISSTGPTGSAGYTNYLKKNKGKYNIVSKESRVDVVPNIEINYYKEDDSITINSFGLTNEFIRAVDYKNQDIKEEHTYFV